MITKRKFQALIKLASQPLKVAEKKAGSKIYDAKIGKKIRPHTTASVSEKRNDKCR